MEPDETLRAALQRFADGDIGHPDLERIRAGRQDSRRRGPVQTLLAVAVVVLLAVVGAVLVAQALGGRQQQQPITPTPAPSPSQTTGAPTPSSAPTSATAAPSALDFPVNPGAGVNLGPVGGAGDTIAGLRLDAVKIQSGTCGGTPCPAGFTMTVTNTTDANGIWEVFAYTYRDGFAELGNSTQVTLAPGDQAKARITIDTSKAADSGGSSTYSWNWSARS